MQLTIVVPDEIGRRVQQQPDSEHFIAEALARALGKRRAVGESSVANSPHGTGVSQPGAAERIPPDREHAGDDAQEPEKSKPAIRCLSPDDKKRWSAAMRSLFGIHGEPMGAEALQQLSRESVLEENELSRTIITAREE
ncbi:MAG: hypothetical protein GY856_29605 [bacterium]|nr:hypothetical protein [bacterium]